MSEPLALVYAAVAGLAIGGLFFTALWLSLHAAAGRAYGVFWVPVCALLRITATLAVSTRWPPVTGGVPGLFARFYAGSPGGDPAGPAIRCPGMNLSPDQVVFWRQASLRSMKRS